MTLWSAAGGDAAAAMKGSLSLVNAGEARCGGARASQNVKYLTYFQLPLTVPAYTSLTWRSPAPKLHTLMTSSKRTMLPT
jgi:hypothetical protein